MKAVQFAPATIRTLHYPQKQNAIWLEDLGIIPFPGHKRSTREKIGSKPLTFQTENHPLFQAQRVHPWEDQSNL